ncbi:MAG: 50S ribosomal protein L7/L12 [Candidatus Hydrogenedentota bacterium]
MAITKEEVKNFIKSATILEISELVKELEKELGVSAQAPVTVAQVAQADSSAQAVKEEKTEFDVIMTAVGDKKIQVVKEVKTIINKDLKESKTLVDNIPAVIVSKVSKEKAEEIKTKLEAVGATVEIK